MALVVLVAIFVLPSLLGGGQTKQFTYSTFVNKVDKGVVKQVTIDPQGGVNGTLKKGAHFTTRVPTALDTSNLQSKLSSHHVTVKATGGRGGWSQWLVWLIPFALIFLVFWWIGRRMRQAGGAGGLGALTKVGQSKAKLYDTTRPTTKFSDVAGYEGVKQEVAEVVDYLRRPERYQRAGAVGPKGVLMLGPPGTGKTLLARAVAGEAAVPFLSADATTFVEMFVGVGASRVRDLFEEARKRAPAIIFVDELDAVGQKRSGAGGGTPGSHSEREQTLQQMLAEMDGFEANTGVIVMGATNRPEILDQALLRPGRFDRHVMVPLPTKDERRAILAVHAKGKKIGEGVDFDEIARMTPGFSGADLAHLVNEAAIFAIRDDRIEIRPDDMVDARDRAILGRRDETNALLPDEQRLVAAHEGGHALVASLAEHADPVARVTILPAGQALGATEQLPEERHVRFEGYLRDTLAVRLAGRAAELLVFGQPATGAANDLSNATQLATKMVREYGMSTAIGPIGFSDGSSGFLGDGQLGAQRPYAEATQRRMDEEIAAFLREAEGQAYALLRRHRPALERLMDLLVEEETVSGHDVQKIARDAPPSQESGQGIGPEPREPRPDPSRG